MDSCMVGGLGGGPGGGPQPIFGSLAPWAFALAEGAEPAPKLENQAIVLVCSLVFYSTAG